MIFGLRNKQFSQLIGFLITVFVLIGTVLVQNAYFEQSSTGAESASLPPSPDPSPSVLSASTSAQLGSLYKIVKVVDGDTIKVDIDGTTETVRLVGINSPETVDPRNPVECMGSQATLNMKTLVENQQVHLESDPTQSDRDRYGRLLRFVFLPDGRDVGKVQIAAGFAYESLYSSKPHRYRDAYVEAQSSAQHALRGLWNEQSCPTNAL